MLPTALTEMFGLEHPIVLAPMGGVSVEATAILRGCARSCRGSRKRPPDLGVSA
jgi:hypothetical protein